MTSRISACEFIRDATAGLSCAISLLVLFGSGCIYTDCGAFFSVRMRLVDADSGAAVVGAIVGYQSFANGAEISNVPPYKIDGTPSRPPSNADGSIVIGLSNYFGPCPVPDFPGEDRLEITIIHDGCEQRFAIEINEDTVQFVDGEFPGDKVLEFTDPILVPLCEQ